MATRFWPWREASSEPMSVDGFLLQAAQITKQRDLWHVYYDHDAQTIALAIKCHDRESFNALLEAFTTVTDNWTRGAGPIPERRPDRFKRY